MIRALLALRRPARGPVALLLAALATSLAAPPLARAAGDREPRPPAVFFPDPDDETRAEIERLWSTSAGDVTKAFALRELLVRRYGVWSVRSLVARLTASSNEAETWNAILTVIRLRGELGPSIHLAPLVRPLTDLLRASEPYRRAFAALALGAFYGPESVRRPVPAREGTPDAYAGYREALVAAQEAVAALLADPHPVVQVAAALSLAKIGGATATEQVLKRLKEASSPSHVEPRCAVHVALGLLPGRDDLRFLADLKDGESRVRACAALRCSAWAVGHLHGGGALPAGEATSRAEACEAALDPIKNLQIRLNDRDGAEATYARGTLATLTGRQATWPELFTLATDPSNRGGVSTIAAAQVLLFAPAEAEVRRQMAELVGRPRIAQRLGEPVIAAFLEVAGADGTPIGVASCSAFLRNGAREPHGKASYDVRQLAALGLVRAFEAGRIAPEARKEAVDALGKPALVDGEGRTFRNVLEDLVGRTQREALLADAETRISPGTSRLLAAAIRDPDAMNAVDPVDTLVDRLNDAFIWLFALDSIPPAASGGGTGPRVVSRDGVPLRLLEGLVRADPYFSRTDVQADRGRPAPLPPPLAARARGIDR